VLCGAVAGAGSHVSGGFTTPFPQSAGIGSVVVVGQLVVVLVGPPVIVVVDAAVVVVVGAVVVVVASTVVVVVVVGAAVVVVGAAVVVVGAAVVVVVGAVVVVVVPTGTPLTLHVTAPAPSTGRGLALLSKASMTVQEKAPVTGGGAPAQFSKWTRNS
jgi:hypothetical protein